ncbi:IS21 family transposase [Permianibacter aggregans]|uniref:Transposase n=1 Tax=Permianibacter aggregans TaxID=1510150 RepID=A0A4V3D5U5_9GAMM|nr:IS21 family transposase [Permianibacter aggregans]QGX38415.1 IS21 family transposase [Permianibacter aggregans]QGX38483.1 IS21 family transposase [Permianibacter aggregans]QGX39861.1 IS21 family transposase [Permianibacter aggregans]QGX40159.1 IS21 family transposase [Permianibacter aggregans]TDQ41317.1 transposase [Permianibacter aggregans]
MALLSVIRRWHFREEVPIREIARRTGLSRNTVRKYLVSDVVEPAYPARKSPNNLDDYEPTLTSWLFRESRRHRKQRRTVRQLHRDLVALGYTGSYDRVAAFARRWRQSQEDAKRVSGKHVYVPLQFAPGEAFQFDWSEDWVKLNGVSTKLQIAHFKLSYSRAFFLRAYLTQAHEMLFDAHYHAFQAFGGVPRRGIYDNMKTAVDKIGRGKQRQVNQRFQAMVGHYLFEPQFCNPASGWEKGQVEKAVLDARHRLWHEAPSFSSLAELNHWLAARCQSLWQETAHPEYRARSLAECQADEQSEMMPVPAAFDGFVEESKRVSSTCLITHEHTRYSVPASYANRPISLRVYPERLVIVAEAQVIAEHVRVFNREKSTPGRTIYDWRHYLSVVQRKPGALRNGAPFTSLPESFRLLQHKLLKRLGGDREMADILALVLLHDEQLVEQAIRHALELGEPSKAHVLNCLHRLQQPPRPTPLQPPAVLKLVNEPVANTARYDRLRSLRHEQ